VRRTLGHVVHSALFILAGQYAASAMQWTPESIEAELKRIEPVLKELGLKTPCQRTRQLVQTEENWDDPETQRRWQSRIDYWRQVLLGEGPAAWVKMLDLDSPGLKARKSEFSSDGDAAWSAHIRQRKFFSQHFTSSQLLQRLMVARDGWNISNDDHSFRIERAEELLAGKLRIFSLEPVPIDTDADHDWFVQHPRDRLFQISHQVSHHLHLLTLAHLRQPDEKWAKEWGRQVVAHIDQCPALPYGIHDFGKGVDARRPANVAWTHHSYCNQRLGVLILGLLAMKESPAFSERFHGTLIRMIHAHIRFLHEQGAQSYRGNYFSNVSKWIYLTSTLFPEFRERQQWLERMWPQFRAGLKREVLSDGCHHHRSFGYHVVLLLRPLTMCVVAGKLGRKDDIPQDIRKTAEKVIDAFAKVMTPECSTPGINDDALMGFPLDYVLRLAADAFGREDWRYLGTRGNEGKQPSWRSVLLPHAGVATMRSGLSRQANYLFFNVSPDSGHHHPDTLSVQVWSGGRHLLIDPGTGHYYTGERDISKRSWWHNCPTLGKRNLPGNVKPRILKWETTEDLDYAVGQIELGKAKVIRHVWFVDQRYWVVWDEFETPPEQEIWENFHFGVTSDELEITADGLRAQTTLADGANLLLCLGQAGWKPATEKGSRWKEYGAPPTPTTIVHFRADPEAAARGFAAMLVPFQEKAPGLGETCIQRIDRPDDGGVSLQVTAFGESRTLAAKQF